MVDLNVNEDERLDVELVPADDAQARDIAAFSISDLQSHESIRLTYLRNVLYLCMAQNGLCLALGICFVVITRFDIVLIQIAHVRMDLLMGILFQISVVGLFCCERHSKPLIELVLVSTILFALTFLTTAHNHGISSLPLIEYCSLVFFFLLLLLLKINYAPKEPVEAFLYWPIPEWNLHSLRGVVDIIWNGTLTCLALGYIFFVFCFGEKLGSVYQHYGLGVHSDIFSAFLPSWSELPSKEDLGPFWLVLAFVLAALRVSAVNYFINRVISMEAFEEDHDYNAAYGVVFVGIGIPISLAITAIIPVQSVAIVSIVPVPILFKLPIFLVIFVILSILLNIENVFLTMIFSFLLFSFDSQQEMQAST